MKGKSKNFLLIFVFWFGLSPVVLAGDGVAQNVAPIGHAEPVYAPGRAEMIYSPGHAAPVYVPAHTASVNVLPAQHKRMENRVFPAMQNVAPINIVTAKPSLATRFKQFLTNVFSPKPKEAKPMQNVLPMHLLTAQTYVNGQTFASGQPKRALVAAPIGSHVSAATPNVVKPMQNVLPINNVPGQPRYLAAEPVPGQPRYLAAEIVPAQNAMPLESNVAAVGQQVPLQYDVPAARMEPSEEVDSQAQGTSAGVAY